MSKYLAKILTNIIGTSQYHVTNSLTYAKNIIKYKIPENHILLSLDVASVYTNILTDLEVNIIYKKRYRTIYELKISSKKGYNFVQVTPILCFKTIVSVFI